MTYTNNEDIRRAVKAAAAIQGHTLASIARALDISPQLLNDKLNKKHIGFDDVATIAAAIGCRLDFVITPEAEDLEAHNA